MAAQRDNGDMAKAGRPSKEIGFVENPIIRAPTLEEAGIDKNLADRARKRRQTGANGSGYPQTSI